MSSETYERQGVIAWFTRNPVAANLLMLIIVVAGIAAAFSIKKRTFPDFEINKIQVVIDYPGASPGDVEQGISIRVEEALNGIAGIKDIESIAREGSGVTIIDVESGFEVDDILTDVEQAVDGITGLPEETEKPVISKVENDRMNNVIWLSVYGDASAYSLHQVAVRVRDDLLALPEVSKVKVFGDDDLIVAIEVSEHTLREYRLTFAEIAQAVRGDSVDIAAGSVETPDGDIVLRTRGQAWSPTDYARIILRSNPDGSRLRLGDIADIREEFDSDDSLSLFNGKPSISLNVLSAGDGDDIASSAAVAQWVDEHRDQLPQGVAVAVWGDSAYYLQGRLDMMLENMLAGAVLVFLVLSLFLRIRVAFWVIIGIPVSFLGAIWLMPVGPFPVFVNLISLFAFILVLGIVVDDAIIIGESVFTEIGQQGHTIDNVIVGVNRVVVPAMFGVLTTIAAFAPVLTVGGQAGPFFESIGVVVILCLLFSLVESKLILPAHLAHMKRLPAVGDEKGWISRLQDRFNKSLLSFVAGIYRPLLERAVIHRYATIALFVGLLMLTMGAMKGGLVRFVFFPEVPSDFLEVTVKMNPGTAPEVRNQTLEKLQVAIRALDSDYREEHPDSFGLLKHVLIFTNGDTVGQVVVEMTKAEGRTLDAYEIADLWRQRVGDLPGIRVLDIKAGENAGGGKPLFFQLNGDNYPQLQAAARELEQYLRMTDGVHSIENSFESGRDEIILSLKPGARALGLSLADLGGQIRQGFYGEEVERFQRYSDEIRVLLRYPEDERKTLAQLECVRIRTANGDAVPLEEVAELERGQGYASIRRLDGKRSIAVSADVDTSRLEPTTVIDDINNVFMPEMLKRYPGIEHGLEGASLEEQKTLSKLSQAGLLALFMIYALIAIPLRSYTQPFIIMSIIPFGLIGAVFGHGVLGLNLSMLSIYGLIALAGVLVNDSLILVDFINRGREAGMRLRDAVLQAGENRFRAIILTSLTTFLGLVPILLEKSLQAQFVIPMAVSLGFGILFATVITLFLIPALYMMLDDLAAIRQRVWQGAGLAALGKR
ncbi:efflux RND transporter permease subunit [Kistimonas scapharcae]|uniref:Efflux RND transporter permease subunit n=1 Tax=Kistimonas scapharcae TaxID=1036133 RepID=A0ABP8V0U7_9GAMM